MRDSAGLVMFAYAGANLGEVLLVCLRIQEKKLLIREISQLIICRLMLEIHMSLQYQINGLRIHILITMQFGYPACLAYTFAGDVCGQIDSLRL